jgi:hypothetical protein
MGWSANDFFDSTFEFIIVIILFGFNEFVSKAGSKNGMISFAILIFVF